MIEFLAGRILGFLKEVERPARQAKVLIIGLAFKGEPVTSDVRGSTSLDLAQHLKERVGSLIGYDPVVSPAASIRRAGIRQLADIRSAIRGADVVCVMNTNPAFRAFNMRKLMALARQPALLVDTWGLYPPEEIAKVRGVRYLRI
jgi:UDP-N-acetyl-D-mannosaminuronic acid dehydrogenase